MSVPLPPLPTDNLYKFMGLAGLAIMIGSVVLPWRQLDHTSALITQLEVDTAAAGATAAADVKLMELHVERMKALNATPRDSPGLIGEWTEVRKESEAMMARGAQIVARHAELQGKTRAAREAATHSRWFMRLGRYGFGLGAVLLVVGFGLWYSRVQRYQDKLLRFQVLQAEREMRKSTPPQLSPTQVADQATPTDREDSD